MSEARLQKAAGWPAWAETVRRKYLSGEASMFILHLNVFDQILYQDRFYSLSDLLGRVLLWETKRNILSYDPAAGVTIIKRGDAATVAEGPLPNRSPSDVLPALEKVLYETDSNALLITYAGMLLPAGSASLLSEQDRFNLITLHRWSLSPEMTAKDNVVFLLAESLAEIHPKLVSNPKVAAVEIPLPSFDERRAVIRKSDPSIDAEHVDMLAKHTAGLKSVQIASLLTPATPQTLDDQERRRYIVSLLATGKDIEERADKLAALTRGMDREEIRHLINPDSPPPEVEDDDPYVEVLELVSKRKREIIEKECHGLIEFVDAKHDFSVVGGHDAIKNELIQIAGNIKGGKRSRVPMGLLFVGPMGSGKTFVAGAFAKTSGLSAVKLKNFRSKWVGSTEANLEKVLSMVRALGPIILIIDEGDRAFGDAGDSDGGTSSRVIARIKEFMSDPENRGNVLFILMTNRPDKLDVDIKRAGRLDRKIPFFYAYAAEDVEAVLDALSRRHGLDLGFAWKDHRASTSQRLLGYSNADLEAVVLLAHDAHDETTGPMTAETFAAAVGDYMPPRDTQMLEYMELLAVFEASKRSMLPEKYRDLTADELNQKLIAMRMAMRL